MIHNDLIVSHCRILSEVIEVPHWAQLKSNVHFCKDSSIHTFITTPLYMSFWRSGWTPDRENRVALKTRGASSVETSISSNFCLPHFTWTIKQIQRYKASQSADMMSSGAINLGNEKLSTVPAPPTLLVPHSMMHDVVKVKWDRVLGKLWVLGSITAESHSLDWSNYYLQFRSLRSA